jgi:3-phenylpropionate/cinnamic acid dioxygenase small subunit
MSSAVGPEDRVAISDVLLRYATAIDTRDWSLFESCFTDDCRADYGEVGSWRGRDEFTEFMRQVHDMCGHSLHRITNCVVSGTDERVKARSCVDAIVLFPDNENGTRAAGFYDDEVVHTGHGWRIAQRKYTMIHLAVLATS